ncbi:MAG: response regulator transcription factor [Spirochaetes bacterium]|nr:response regulator transcription factor [Spirochaetota bacterium]
MKHTVLIIEDDPHILGILDFLLTDEGYEVLLASSGEEGLSRISHNEVDLVIIDINLPGINGLEVCNRIKQKYAKPVIIVSSRDQDSDVISGLELGADDYIKKPFNHRELILRVANIVERLPKFDQDKNITIGTLTIDIGHQMVYRDTIDLHLTQTEFAVIHCLSKHVGFTVSWYVICNEVWGSQDWDGGRELVKVNIRRLRKKLEQDPSQPEIIVNEWGKGYKLVPEALLADC